MIQEHFLPQQGTYYVFLCMFSSVLYEYIGLHGMACLVFVFNFGHSYGLPEYDFARYRFIYMFLKLFFLSICIICLNIWQFFCCLSVLFICLNCWQFIPALIIFLLQSIEQYFYLFCQLHISGDMNARSRYLQHYMIFFY